MSLYHCDRPEHGYGCFHLDDEEEHPYANYLRTIMEEGRIVTPVLDKQGQESLDRQGILEI